MPFNRALHWAATLAVALFPLGGCSSDTGQQCKLSGGTTLATSPWPSFRRDTFNSGRSAAAVPRDPTTARRIFPPAGTSIGAVTTAPILGEDRIFLGSQDGTVYVIDRDGQPVLEDDDGTSKHLDATAPVAAAPLLDGNGNLFVSRGDGTLTQYEPNGDVKHSTLIGGFLAASANVGADGTVYLGSLSGIFGGICPNGVARFFVVFSSIQATAAVMADPEDDEDRIIILGEESGQVRALDIRGRERWSFFASSAIRGSIVLTENGDRFYVADSSGRVFAGDPLDGRRLGSCLDDSGESCKADSDCATGTCSAFGFRAGRCAGTSDSPCMLDVDCQECRDGSCVGDPSRECATDPDCSGIVCTPETISASPALGDLLYVPTVRERPDGNDGALYALDPQSGELRWFVSFAAPVLSSPAVADGEGTDAVLVGAASVLYAVEDGEILWDRELESPVGSSSPTVDGNGTVYVGTQDGLLLAVSPEA